MTQSEAVAASLRDAKELAGRNQYGQARQILIRVLRQSPNHVKASQQLALATYKDEELPPDERFSKGLAILESIGLRKPDCKDKETLGQGGAIHKRRWERNGHNDDLLTALHYYSSGWERNPAADQGYCGINAAFLLDVLAYRARARAKRQDYDSGEARLNAERARALRRDMLERVPGFVSTEDAEKYWHLVTMAEIEFGLGHWEAAREWLTRARGAAHDEWERQTTAKQLVAIARMAGFQPPRASATNALEPPWEALRALLGEDARAAFESYRGKVGLALSGGGFRASLYHLGVLARLAECDALRCVEVLSTVSGGSILGAHYYLALRQRLREKTDAQLGRDDYIEVVRGVIAQFCAGVQRNLRVRAFSNLWSNLKMLMPFFAYGRSNRMGELYERHLYASVTDKMERPRKMRDLLIHPLVGKSETGDEFDQNFKPKFSNWRRHAKVPILLLNTTSLNSGHNWHFTATWMGEPPGLTGQEVDMNERYRRLYYSQAPAHLQDYPLGHAVAASAGVPALFDPLELARLYPERSVRLVDGGVHDNQGVAGLLDEGCNLLLCSDASGQMDDQSAPATNELSVFFRSDSILQDRLREAQYQDLAWRLQSNALQGFFFIHLKQELDTDPLGWVGIKAEERIEPKKREARTNYGVDRTIQRRLAALRTDLDTFSESEAYSLMASGYLTAKHQLLELNRIHEASGLSGNWGDFEVDAPRRLDWVFEPILSVVAADPQSDNRAQDLERQLAVGQRLLGKVWFLVPGLKWTAITAGVAAVIAGLLWIMLNWDATFLISYNLGVKSVVVAAVGAALALILPFGRHIRWLGDTRKWLLTFLAAFVGWAGSLLYLVLLDPLYRRRGALERLLKRTGSQKPSV